MPVGDEHLLLLPDPGTCGLAGSGVVGDAEVEVEAIVDHLGSVTEGGHIERCGV